MKIRADFIGCVFVDGHRLFAGEEVPQGSRVASWITSTKQYEQDELNDPSSDDPAVSTPTNPVGETEIVTGDDEEISGDNDDTENPESESVEKPTRADSKANWFAYADSVGAIKEGTTAEDYSKADLVELVG